MSDSGDSETIHELEMRNKNLEDEHRACFIRHFAAAQDI